MFQFSWIMIFIISQDRMTIDLSCENEIHSVKSSNNDLFSLNFNISQVEQIAKFASAMGIFKNHSEKIKMAKISKNIFLLTMHGKPCWNQFMVYWYASMS